MSKTELTISQIPYDVRNALCSMLELDYSIWQGVAGIMKCSLEEINEFSKAKSPSDALLHWYGKKGRTVSMLYAVLALGRFKGAMKIIEQLVDEEIKKIVNDIPQDSEIRNTRHAVTEVPMASCSSTINAETMRNTEVVEKIQKKILIQENVKPKKIVATLTRSHNPQGKLSGNCDDNAPSSTSVICYKSIEEATNAWASSNKLGSNSQSSTYLGKWKNQDVAIKRLDSYITEVNESVKWEIIRDLRKLRELSHDNILKMLYFLEGSDRPCIVFPYITYGSLQDRILCKNRETPLTWDQRWKISGKITDALIFLENSDHPVVIKSSDVLLTSDFSPLLTDIKTYAMIRKENFFGYLPHDTEDNRDTFSLGVVHLELASGQCAYDPNRKYKTLTEAANLKQCKAKDFRDSKAPPQLNYLFKCLLALGNFYVSEDRLPIAKCSNYRDDMIAKFKKSES